MILKVQKLIPSFKALSFDENKKAVIISSALEGEVLDVEIYKQYKNYSLAHTKDVLEKSPYREEPICKNFAKCGACELLYMSYECEKKYKDMFYKSLFDDFEDIKIEDSVFKGRLNSRCRTRVHISDDKKGFMAYHSNNIIDIDNCPLLDDELNIRIKRLPFSKNSTIEDVNILKSNIEICGIKYATSDDVFFQSNIAIAQEMLKYVSQQVRNRTVLDLYAGIGFFSSYIEKMNDVDTIIAVESNKKCLEFAKKNLKRTIYCNIPFEKFKLSRFVKDRREITLIIDPPRAGLSKAAMKNIISLSAKDIIYVSCNIASNINDIKELSKNSYKPVSAKLFDMYPATSHMESVVLLTKF